MKAVVTRGHGDYDRLDYCDVPVPVPQAGEVLLQVLAAGVNNTDINTRVGWYSSAPADSAAAPGGWNGATPFPLVQGADCCGRVVALGEGVLDWQPGARVLVRSCMRTAGFESLDTRWLGTDFDGAFAQYVVVPASEVFAVQTDWTDAQLATIPCAYGTAENMLHRAQAGPLDHVLVTGASGGVGSALVQLARRRGARVTAITSRDKLQQVRAIGADPVFVREDDLLALLGANQFDVVADNVAGPAFGSLLKLLRRGGKYVSSGAIAGADVALDMRDLYLKDITLLGCTAWDAPVFPSLIGYIERGEIQPLLAATFALHDIALAQAAFLEKRHTGNIVLLP
jgi:NADPH:quinone reductase-like Zn-dependent oxidoreductase